jgi:WD40 repeat protein
MSQQSQDLSPSVEELISRVADEYQERLERGEHPSVEVYTQRYPQIASTLQQILSAVAALFCAGARRQASTSPGASLPASPPGYALLKEIGRGGMGVVYKARQLALGRVVALKMIRAGVHADEQQRARFRGEAEAVARLRHPNVVQIHEVGDHDGLPYLALEYVEGGTLTDALAGTPLPGAVAARLVETLAGAVEAAHRERIIHRDLKPANVLLVGTREEGQGAGQAKSGATSSLVPGPSSLIPKIADFGLAKRLDETGETQSGAILGTPSYMAPEQARGKSKEAGPPIDVYALGAILYECLTGRPPFKADNPIDTLRQVIEDDPVSPRLLQPTVPRDLETVCLKCLQKEPHRRYASAQALAEDLRRFQEGRPVVARPVGVLGRLARWARRRPAAALASGLLFLVLVVGGLGSGAVWLWQRAEEDKTRAEQEREKAENAEIEAKAARRSAEDARGKEEKAREAAQKAQAQEEQAKNQEKKAREELAQVDYLHRVHLAHRYWQDNDIRRCRALLAECPKDLRHWEWHHVNRLCEDCVYSVTTLPSTRAAFSPDGKYLFTYGNGVIAWDARTGARVADLKPSSTGRRNLVFSPDGKQFADPVMSGGIDLCDALTGKVKLSLDTGRREALGVAFSADGQRLTGYVGDGFHTVRVWDASTGREEKELALKCPRDSFYHMAVSPDGKLVAVGSSGQGAYLCDLGTGEQTVTLQGDKGYVNGLAFSPDGKLLAASVSETVRVWEVRTGLLTRTFPQLQGRTYQVAFSPDGKQLAFGGRNGMVCVCDVETGKETLLLRGVNGALTVAFSPDGTRLAAGGWGEMRVWDAHAQQEARMFRNGEGRAEQHSVALSADGKRLASYVRFSNRIDRPDRRDVVKVWDVETGKELRSLQGGSLGFDFRPDGRQVALSGPGFPTLWDVDTGREGPALKRRGWALRVVYSGDGKRLACRNAGGAVQVWDVETGDELLSLPTNVNAGTSVDLSRDGKRLATVQTWDPPGVKVWDVDTRRLLHTLPANASGAGALVAFTADGRRLTGVADRTVHLWDVETGREVRCLRDTVGGTLNATAFGPDGRRMVRMALILDVETGREILSVAGGQVDISGVAFSADGRLLAAGYRDGTVNVWDGTPRAAAPSK